MDYDVVKTSSQNAYKNFMNKDGKFYSAMSDFYKEGEKNPTVAKIILQEEGEQYSKAVKRHINELASVNYPETSGLLYPEILNSNHRIYEFSLNSSLRTVTAEDLYENTRHLSDDCFVKGREEFDAKWQAMYPKTGKIRERIISANRMSSALVTPKADWHEKINYAKTMAEYRKDYPKTFNARYFLLSSEQISDGEVTPRIKNWFRRLFYKSLIKGKYCFKK